MVTLFIPLFYGIAREAVNSTKFSCDTLPHMSIRAGVVVAVALQQIDDAPNAQASAQRGHEGLQSRNSRSEKRHNVPP